MKKRKVHIVTYTHWDREFRWEFERTRMRLVDCIDHLLEIMKSDPDYTSFLLDGQFTLVDDYLEIRPEKKSEIIKHIKDGRLEIGPWYTLADCAPIQGESVVRNLFYGMRRSKEYGDVMKCGYNVFSFGQIGQLPQIYANFGIDTILFYKYMDPSKSKYHEFIWEAPDGTRALASRLGKEARWNFFFAGHIPIVYDKDAWDKEWQYKWGELGKVFHTADAEGYGWFYEILDPDTSFHKKNIKLGMERALKTVEGTAAPECVLLFEGTDFTEPHPLTTEIIKEIQAQCDSEIEVVHSTLTDYIKEINEILKDREDLDIVSGPLRDGPVGAVHTDVFSIHPEIKIENSRVENTLIRYAEPLSAIAWKLGVERYPCTYLEKIWKLMFQSHAHDSMHGLGPHTVSEGQLARLSQAHTIALGLERRALQNVTKEINTNNVIDTEYFLAVHNPSSFERSEVVEAYIDIPKDAKLNYLVIEDMHGNKVPVQEVGREETRAGIYHPRSRNMPFYCTRIHVYYTAAGIPALGYKTFKVKWVEKDEYPYPHEDWDAPHIHMNTMLTGLNQAENQYMKVNVQDDGTVTIKDKVTGRIYTDLNYFLDAGDKGNMWMSVSPGKDRIISSKGIPAHISVTTHGPLIVKFSIELNMRLPVQYDWDRGERSAFAADMAVTVELTLKKDSRYLEVRTVIHNTVKDHYFKVCFSTMLQAEKTWAEGSFMVTEYPVKPSSEGDMRGNELARHPAQLWFDLYDGDNGFAVLSDAAKDYEVIEYDDKQTLAMGLLRGVRLRIPCDNRLWMEYPGDESAQSLGEYSYHYALMPHSGKWDEAGLYQESIAFNTAMHVCQFGKQEGILPAEKSFVKIHNANLVISSIKKAEDRESMILRIFNPTGESIKDTIVFGFPCAEAYAVNMNEDREQEMELCNGVLPVSVPNGKILTIEIV